MDSMTIYILERAFEEFIPNPNNLLFCRENGDLISEGASNSAYKRFCLKHKITKGKEITQYMLRHSFSTRKIEGGMPAQVLKVILGHSDVSITINTYFDAFAEYNNTFEEKTYNYLELQGLTFDILDKDFIIMQELNSMLEKVNISHLSEVDKEQLLLLIENIANKYNNNNKKEENIEEESEENVNSNIIMFPMMCR